MIDLVEHETGIDTGGNLGLRGIEHIALGIELPHLLRTCGRHRFRHVAHSAAEAQVHGLVAKAEEGQTMAFQVECRCSVHKILHSVLHVAGSISGRTEYTQLIIAKHRGCSFRHVVNVVFGHAERGGYLVRHLCCVACA